jgi:ankyrin repeat protein
MKIRTLVSILIVVLAILIITEGCATTPKPKKERGDINQEVFFRAVNNGEIAEVRGLIGAGADVKTKDNNGWTALMGASQKGHTEIAELLIEAGADVSAQDDEGLNAYMVALYYGHREIA